MHSLEFAKSKGIQIKFHGRNKNEASHYCGQCDVSFIDNFFIDFSNTDISLQEEVFNVLYIKEQGQKHVVHCMGCSRKQSPNLQGFVCLEEYKLSELTQVYDAFVLQKPPPVPVTPAPFMPPPQTPVQSLLQSPHQQPQQHLQLQQPIPQHQKQQQQQIVMT